MIKSLLGPILALLFLASVSTQAASVMTPTSKSRISAKKFWSVETIFQINSLPDTSSGMIGPSLVFHLSPKSIAGARALFSPSRFGDIRTSLFWRYSAKRASLAWIIEPSFSFVSRFKNDTFSTTGIATGASYDVGSSTVLGAMFGLEAVNSAFPVGSLWYLPNFGMFAQMAF